MTSEQSAPTGKNQKCKFCSAVTEADKDATWLERGPSFLMTSICGRCQRCPACGAKASAISELNTPTMLPPNDRWFVRMRCPVGHEWSLEREISSPIPKVVATKKARVDIIREITKPLMDLAKATGEASRTVRKFSDAAGPLEDLIASAEPRTGARFVEGAEMACRACGITGTDYTPLGLSERVCRACLVCPSCGRADGLEQDLDSADVSYVVVCRACRTSYRDGIIGERLQRRREMAEAPPVKVGRFRYLED